MNSRLEALIKKGYPREVVIELSSFNDDELEYASKYAFKHISRNCSPVENPNAIFVGGQPGCGKTVMSMNLKNKIKNIIEIGIDNYRMYHPKYLEIEKCIREFWKGKEETINDTPGNDIANFTHYFAGVMTDKLIEMGKEKNYNMILEWGMREPTGPLKCMNELKQKNYNNTVLFVNANKEISYEACNMRYDIMKQGRRIIRKVPKDFHDYCVETLPDSINKIHEEGLEKNLIDYMAIVKRNNEVIWDLNSKELPGSIFIAGLNAINNSKNNLIVASNINQKEMIGLGIRI